MGSTENTPQEVSRLMLLETEVQILRSRSKTFSAQVLYLEKENQELRAQLKNLEEEHHNLQSTIRERRLHTSEVEAINRSNRRRIRQLEEDLWALRNSHKTREFIKDNMHSCEVERLKEESSETLKSQENMFIDAMDKMQAQSDTVAQCLTEESREKTELFKMAVEYAQEVQSVNLKLAAYVVEQNSELFRGTEIGNSGKFALVDEETGVEVETVTEHPGGLALTEGEEVREKFREDVIMISDQ